MKLVKSFGITLLAVLMALSMAACNKADKAYLAKVTELDTQIAELNPLMSQEGLSVEESVKLLEDCKVLYSELAALEAPKKYAEAHAKIKSGCDALVEYMDIAINAANGDIAEDAQAKMTELQTKATADLTEGMKLLNAA